MKNVLWLSLSHSSLFLFLFLLLFPLLFLFLLPLPIFACVDDERCEKNQSIVCRV